MSAPSLEQRVVALESQFPLVVANLSLAALIRKLEATWEIPADEMLAAGSLAIASARDVHYGRTNVTWPGGSPNSDIVAIGHGFDAPPQFFAWTVYSSSDIGTHRKVDIGAPDNTTFAVQIVCDSDTPAVTVETPIQWVAFA